MALHGAMYACRQIATVGSIKILLIMQICAHVQGLYLLEVRLNGYENQDGKCVDSRCHQGQNNMNMHSCCDDFRKFEDCNLSDCACDSYFIFCLRTFGTV